MLYPDNRRKNDFNSVKTVDILDDLIHRLKKLEKQRNQVVEEVCDLIAEVEIEAEELERGLSILKGQITEFEAILNILRKRKKRKWSKIFENRFIHFFRK
jgi:predicted  nucleic acid-binding Zn-ribbon protein